MVVLEGQIVLALFWHLHPNSCLPDPTALGPVGLQQVFSAVVMKTSLTEVLAPLVLVLIIQKAVEVLYQGVVEFAGLLNQQQVDAGHVDRLFAEVMDNYLFFPAKDVDGQVILFLNPWDMGNGCGGINPFKVEVVLGRILARSVHMVCGRIKGLIVVPNGGNGHPCFSH